MTLIHSAGELNHLPALFTCHLDDEANGPVARQLQRPCHRPPWLISVSLGERFSNYATRPQQFLYFFPLPQGHGSLRPTFGMLRRTGRSSVISPAPSPSPSPATAAIAPTG